MGTYSASQTQAPNLLAQSGVSGGNLPASYSKKQDRNIIISGFEKKKLPRTTDPSAPAFFKKEKKDRKDINALNKQMQHLLGGRDKDFREICSNMLKDGKEIFHSIGGSGKHKQGYSGFNQPQSLPHQGAQPGHKQNVHPPHIHPQKQPQQQYFKSNPHNCKLFNYFNSFLVRRLRDKTGGANSVERRKIVIYSLI